MKEVIIKCFERKELGKERVKKLRNQEFIPGVVYGPGISNMNVSVPDKELREIIYNYGTSCIVNLQVDENKIPTIIKEIQKDYLGADIIHVDFYRIQKEKEVEISIPVFHVGKPVGEVDGGILEQHVYNIKIKSLPENIPQRVEVDVSEMKLGDNLNLGIIKLPDGVALLDLPDVILFTLIPPRGIAEEEEKPAIEEVKEGEEAEETKEEKEEK
jgi:large subunit ribosomal protein L25